MKNLTPIEGRRKLATNGNGFKCITYCKNRPDESLETVIS